MVTIKQEVLPDIAIKSCATVHFNAYDNKVIEQETMNCRFSYVNGIFSKSVTAITELFVTVLSFGNWCVIPHVIENELKGIQSWYSKKKKSYKNLVCFVRGLPFIFRDLTTLVLQSANWQLYGKARHFWSYTYAIHFHMRALFVLFTVT